MLVSVKFKFDPFMASLLNAIGQGGAPIEIQTGIYQTNSFSLGNSILNEKDDYPDFSSQDEYLGSYGVADSLEQVKQRYGKYLSDPNENYCISVTEVRKDEQESQGGWRWHKWGEYIGDKDPQCEYLYDEGDDIQSVIIYHIYKILD